LALLLGRRSPHDEDVALVERALVDEHRLGSIVRTDQQEAVRILAVVVDEDSAVPLSGESGDGLVIERPTELVVFDDEVHDATEELGLVTFFLAQSGHDGRVGAELLEARAHVDGLGGDLEHGGECLPHVFGGHRTVQSDCFPGHVVAHRREDFFNKVS
jgi:hypothetical protein